MKVHLEVCISLLQSLPLSLIAAEQVVISSTVKLSDFLLNVSLLGLSTLLLQRLLVVLSWLTHLLFLLLGSLWCGSLLLLLLSEDTSEERVEGLPLH